MYRQLASHHLQPATITKSHRTTLLYQLPTHHQTHLPRQIIQLPIRRLYYFTQLLLIQRELALDLTLIESEQCLLAQQMHRVAQK